MPASHRNQHRSARPGLIRVVQGGIHELKPLFRNMRTAVIHTSRHGLPAVHRDYDQLWQRHVAGPRRAIVRQAVERAAQNRFAMLQDAARERSKVHQVVPLAPQLMSRSVEKILQRPHGPMGWRYADQLWPRDRWIKRTFFSVLQEAERRRDTARLSAASAAIHIDPRLKKIAYPIEPDLSAEQLTTLAADYVVIGRGEYFASIGLRDAAKAVDQAVALVVAGEVQEIVAWRWELSPAHDPKLCPSGVCEAIAEFDAGAGPGVYFDSDSSGAILPLPQSHPACWCSIQPAFDDEFDGTIPQPGPDYESLVMGLMDSYGVTMLTAA